ncbi:Glucan 1,3-beta-glucosidase [Lachnellula suecica]|uniref:glucan 1,3-beta-glucosidase n=1 Tax=Lachnellula suecica TaxID=602035 RepID=A0A8T9BY86_9HELO|nr:Glucan 1,3-beta-glucosidase [Lachnellula suecica]
MWTSLPTALMAIILLSDSASARHRKRTVTINACEATTSTIPSTSTATAPSKVTEASAGIVLKESENGKLNGLSNGEVYAPVVVISTVSVIPMPVGTVSGVFYPGSTGIASGIFYPGQASGSSAARPTGYSNSTGNRTHHHSTGPLKSGSVPFFPLNNTLSVPYPTNSSVKTPLGSTGVLPRPTSVPSVSLNSTGTSTGSHSAKSSHTSHNITTSTFSSAHIPTTEASSSAKPTTRVPTTSSSKPSSTTTSAVPTSTGITKIPFLRGVNLGGWLVLEAWMNSDLFTGDFSSAADEWSISSMSGAKAALQKHWSTFFTEEDVASIAATGINALRIPIGFWAYDNANTPYLQGQDAYLEKAIGWARNNNMYVWVDCHGSPGSQNGFDNSGHKGAVDWQQQSNLDRSISVLETMAAKYGAEEYADVVVGIELTNEPINYDNNVFSVTQKWAQNAYAAVKAKVTNDKLVIVMHDAFEGAGEWLSVAESLIGSGPKTFGIDSHLYQLYTDADNLLTQAQHITEACAWAAPLAVGNAVMPTYVGEWSAATNICVNPDGTTSAGTSCTTANCQCQSASFDDWNDAMIEQVRRYVEAQLDVFESSSSGYFMWAAKGPGGWGFLNGIEKGVVPNPVTDRKYPNQCGLTVRREKRGSLGVVGEAF